MPSQDSRIEQVRELFTDATAVIEDVHEAAVAGQEPGLPRAQYLHHAGTVAAAAARLDALAGAIAVLLQEDGQNQDSSGNA